MKAIFLNSVLCAGLAFGQAPPTPAVPPVPPTVRGLPFNFNMEGGFLGIGLQEITADRAKELKLKEEYGAEITRVWADSPADKAGLKTGDVVLQFNGNRIEGMEQFSRMVRETPVGRDAKLSIWRGTSGGNAAEQTVTVKIGQRPMPFGLGDGNFVMPDVPRIIQGMRSPVIGVDAEALEGQLAEYFGAKDGGVLLRSIGKATAAEKAGLKAGDVIVRIDETKVTSPREVAARLRSSAGKTVAVVILRDRKEATVPVEVPESQRRTGRVERMRFVTVEDAH